VLCHTEDNNDRNSCSHALYTTVSVPCPQQCDIGRMVNPQSPVQAAGLL
jgi:hypothetical protein